MSQRSRTSPGESEVLSRAPTWHGLRIRQSELHEPFSLQPRQRGVDRADRNRPGSPPFNLSPYGDAICLVAQMPDGDEDAQLEFANEIPFGHVSSTNAYLEAGCVERFTFR